MHIYRMWWSYYTYIYVHIIHAMLYSLCRACSGSSQLINQSITHEELNFNTHFSGLLVKRLNCCTTAIRCSWRVSPIWGVWLSSGYKTWKYAKMGIILISPLWASCCSLASYPSPFFEVGRGIDLVLTDCACASNYHSPIVNYSSMIPICMLTQNIQA